MSEKLCQALIAVVADLAFVELEKESQGQQAAVPDYYGRMKLSVAHPLAGEMLLAVEPGLLHEITGNIYACDEEQSTCDHELDTLAELLNTIAGRLMQVIVPPAVSYELGLPVVPESDEVLDAPGMSYVFHSVDRPEERRLIFTVVGTESDQRGDGMKIRVLVVDDSPFIQKAIARILPEDDYEICGLR